MNNHLEILETALVTLGADYYTREGEDGGWVLTMFTPGIGSFRVEFQFNANKEYVDVTVH